MRKKDKRIKKPAHERSNNGSDISRRYRLREDEVNILEEYRRIQDEAEKAGINTEDVKSGWLKTEDSSLYFKNPNFKTTEDKGIEDLVHNVIEEVRQYAPKYPRLKRTKSNEGHLIVVDPADIHIGKLSTVFETGVAYNQQIAVKRVLEGVKGLLNKANGFKIDKVALIIGNDILHTDNCKRQTTAGTSQDTDGMWYDNFLTAKMLYVDVIELLMQVADVEVIFNPSNHDYQSGFFLAQVIEAHFNNSKNVTFDCSISHRKYFVYGNSLIGTSHGDGAKQTDLGSLMSVEAKQYWVDSEFRYFYTHHVHHKNVKDYINVTVETLRSPSPADSWHHRNGYVSQPAVEAFIHSKEYGQIARLTHYF